MRIAILGYSGSGKSTLARMLGKRYNVEVLHLDTVHFLPNWEERDPEDELRTVETFLDSHDSWVIDGNYTKLSYERRMEEADRIIIMLFNRFVCLRRVVKRFCTYRNTSRPDMAEGCKEKLDRAFVSWVLWSSRRKPARDRYARLRKLYSDKVTILRNQKQADAFMR